jgi:hypothetical protein
LSRFASSSPRTAQGVAPARDGRRIEPARRARERTSVGDALSRLVEATERAVSDRIELTRLEAEHSIERVRSEAEEALGRALRGSAFISAGAALAIGGWFVLMAALIVFLRRWLSLEARIALVGAANVSIALVLVSTGIAQMRRPRLRPGG